MASTERSRAERMAVAQRRLNEAEAKLAELERYHKDYAQNFTERASAGLTTAWLRDYQAFLARLLEAVTQQRQIVARALADHAIERRQWQEAAQRVAAVENVVERWRGDERRDEEKRDQRETDERATIKHNKTAGH